ncbi:MAG: dehH1 2 [Thermomicrobiales bacterium]|nr:dehH1 2 [Thermomicrobiales bacterium]
MSDRVPVAGGELEYDVQGMGEPVLLIHGAILADAFTPLLTQPALADDYRLIAYHRRGFAGSCRHAGPCSLVQQAADARAVLDQLGIERAHVVGHSYGGMIALQLALDAPDQVATLALLEPAGIAAPSGERFGAEVIQPSTERYTAGDRAGAVELFFQGVCGPQAQEVAARTLPPGAFDLAVTDADTFFETEWPALLEWQFGPAEAVRIAQPVLLVLGADSDAVTPMFGEMNAALAEWLPDAESVQLPEATHALQMMNPVGTAELLTAFFARHPIATTVAERAG